MCRRLRCRNVNVNDYFEQEMANKYVLSYNFVTKLVFISLQN